MKLLKIALPVLGIAIVAGGALFALNSCGKETYRSNLDKYIELETEAVLKAHLMQPGVAVYVDFSDGMNAAYGTSLSQDALKNVVNTFTAAEGGASFYSLANNEITPLELSQTELYNAIMSGKNYTKTMAPIEQSLKQIVANNQAALLITDYEEYNAGRIQQQAYAKTYFTQWLKKGYNITFYKIDYKEGAKPKHLFFTVFDSPLNNLSLKVEQSLSSLMAQGIEKFVLAAPDCTFTLATSYPSANVGGNFHDADDKDNITGTLEDGTDEAFKLYTHNITGTASTNSYTLFFGTYGPLTEYYPFGVKHNDVLTNIDTYTDPELPKEDRFTNLISKVYVDFTTQSGYDIKALDTRVTDVEPRIAHFASAKSLAEAQGETVTIPTDMPSVKEVADLFTVIMKPASINGLAGNWQEIIFDYDPRFKGNLPASMNSDTDLLKAEIVIANAAPRTEEVDRFFSWPGNSSLSASVINVLNDAAINPIGRPVVVYYIKVL